MFFYRRQGNDKTLPGNNNAMTPYSALAGGRLSKKPGETSKRLLTKVIFPIVGAVKIFHVEGMAKAVDLCLTKEELYCT